MSSVEPGLSCEIQSKNANLCTEMRLGRRQFWPFFASMIALCAAPSLAFAQAGGSGGNGGDAVAEGKIIDRVQDGFRLLDFYQVGLKDDKNDIAGIADQFYASADLEKLRLKRDLGKIVQELELTFDAKKQRNLVALIGQEDPLLARILAAPFAMYSWERQTNVVYVNDYQDADDYEPSLPYRYNDGIWRVSKGVHQVGRRIMDKIEIAEPVFANMYAFDQLGLLMHEAIYSLFVKAPELPYGQNPTLVRATVVDWFKHRLGRSQVNTLESGNFEFNKILPQARKLYIPGEALSISYKRGEFYRIDGEKFAIEFRFEDYKTQLFDTKYLQPKLIVK